MSTIRISLDVESLDPAHTQVIAVSLSRVARCLEIIVNAEPHTGTSLLAAFQACENPAAGVMTAEIEYASFLAGLAYPGGAGHAKG